MKATDIIHPSHTRCNSPKDCLAHSDDSNLLSSCAYPTLESPTEQVILLSRLFSGQVVTRDNEEGRPYAIFVGEPSALAMGTDVKDANIDFSENEGGGSDANQNTESTRANGWFLHSMLLLSQYTLSVSASIALLNSYPCYYTDGARCVAYLVDWLSKEKHESEKTRQVNRVLKIATALLAANCILTAVNMLYSSNF